MERFHLFRILYKRFNYIQDKKQTISFILLRLTKGIIFWSQISKLLTLCAFNGWGKGLRENNSKLQLYCSWNLLTCLKVYLQLISVSFLRFPSSENLKLKAHSEYQIDRTQLKGSIPWTYPKVFQEFGKH